MSKNCRSETCSRCKGTGQEAYHSPSGVEGDTSTHWIDCRMCGGGGRVPAKWRDAWYKSGFEGRCEQCRVGRPTAIMDGPTGDILLICALCAAKQAVLEEAAS